MLIFLFGFSVKVSTELPQKLENEIPWHFPDFPDTLWWNSLAIPVVDLEWFQSKILKSNCQFIFLSFSYIVIFSYIFPQLIDFSELESIFQHGPDPHTCSYYISVARLYEAFSPPRWVMSYASFMLHASHDNAGFILFHHPRLFYEFVLVVCTIPYHRPICILWVIIMALLP